ncbi:hypothetical protein [Neisseria musculi]|uniref:Membrane protein n=2 Tax=Neisseria musculi TaxID=1815583 RepID=A0A7H1MF65_9NEIS|nr:hypothetical protein [Neisseria musculi]QNT60280.1 putative membrane protein [Neisseria musculi]
MKRLLTPLPIWLILADTVYTFTLNILQSFNPGQSLLPKDGLPVSPDIAFGWLQAATHGGMAILIGFGLWTLLKLNQSVLRQQDFPVGVFRALGLTAVLAFGIPSLWLWSVSLSVPAEGGGIAWDSPRYLAVSLCQAAAACLCLHRLAVLYLLRRRTARGRLCG